MIFDLIDAHVDWIGFGMALALAVGLTLRLLRRL